MTGSTPVKVLLVDDHPFVLDALESRLQRHGGFELVGRAVSGEAALVEAEQHRPDLVLVDLRMPGIGGLETIRRLKALLPTVKVVVLTVSDCQADLVEAIIAGAAGYVLKESRPELLLEAIRATENEKSLLPSAVLHGALEGLSHGVRAERDRQELEFPLTDRQAEVLRMLSAGNSTKEMMAALDVTEATVKKHIHGLLAKLGAADRTQAVVFAIQRGLVDPADDGTV